MMASVERPIGRNSGAVWSIAKGQSSETRCKHRTGVKVAERRNKRESKGDARPFFYKYEMVKETQKNLPSIGMYFQLYRKEYFGTGPGGRRRWQKRLSNTRPD
jgi:hypothetical protein